MQNGKPRGQHGSNEGNQVVGEVGSGEEVGALYEGEQVVGELGVAADGNGDTGRVERKMWSAWRQRAGDGTRERGREVDEGARDGAVVTSRRKHRRPQQVSAEIEAFVWSNGVDTRREFFPLVAAAGLVRDRGQAVGPVVVTREHCSFGFGNASPSQGLVAREGGLDHEEVEGVSQRPRKELEGWEKIFSASCAGLQLGESLTNLRAGRDERKDRRTVASRVFGVGDEVVQRGGGIGVAFLAV